MKHKPNALPILLLVLAILGLCIISCKEEVSEKVMAEQLLEKQISVSLDSLVKVWYPRVLDRDHGGYWSDYDYAWELDGIQDKMIVSQARHIWATATLAQYYADPSFLEMARHGYLFLRDHMWDGEHGGFFTQKRIYGDTFLLVSKTKSAYGNAFGIYGLSAYYKASGDTAALDLAKKTFYWLEEHAHDPEYGGYFDVLKQDGSWLLDVEKDTAGYENFVRKDWKDQNSSIHLMEAFTALYEVWPDSLLRKRLEELLKLIRDTITTEKGYLTLHLERDWTPVSLRDSSESYRRKNFFLDHVSFGHDVETAYLMLETSHALGLENDTTTLKKAKKMVDHALDNGWDDRFGGFYDGGYYPAGSDKCVIQNGAKVWWSEAEGLNALLLMARLFPEEERYFQHFRSQWHYIDHYLIDHEHGGWYHEGIDSDPAAAMDPKANIWKTSYHNTRALMNVVQMLRGTYRPPGEGK